MTFSEVKPVGFANNSDVSSEREDHGWLLGLFFKLNSYYMLKPLKKVENS